MSSKPPLSGVRVIDFSTLLPGPLATLVLAEAGAEVIKIERPDGGDDQRRIGAPFGEDHVGIALLNRGKKSIAIDLKAAGAAARLHPLIASAQVLVQQFRPGVMDRLGLGYAAVRAINPRIVYCSITGYGQTGPKAAVAAHDLNYMADTGVLALGADTEGRPVLPPGLIADIGGGTYPAVINILLALRQAEQTGEGSHLDIAMADHLFTWSFWALGQGLVTGDWPAPGGGFVTGASPRYQIYRTADGKFLAVGALEQKFWDRFCELIALDPPFRDDRSNPEATKAAVARRIAEQPIAHWHALFEGEDVCCAAVRPLADALADPHYRGRGLFDRQVEGSERGISALPVPVALAFRRPERSLGYPRLGADNDLLDDGDKERE